MPASAHSKEELSQERFHEAFHAADEASNWDGAWVIDPDERITTPQARGPGLAIRIGVVALLTATGAGLVMYGQQLELPDWVSTEASSLMAKIGNAASISTRPLAPSPLPDRAEPAAVPEAKLAVPAEAETKQVDAAPLTTGALPPAADHGEVKAGPLPAPLVDPGNPYQKRAQAAGLHPELSQVVLKRLTPADYKNAGVAIKTALAETADDEVFVWPRQRAPEQALFHVRFVQGAAPDCRRYVVAITKDGWLTTALPMETCGVKPVLAKRKP